MIRAGEGQADVHLATRNMEGHLTLSACGNVGVILTRDAGRVTCKACQEA